MRHTPQLLAGQERTADKAVVADACADFRYLATGEAN
jgi:hypothetical protein